MKWLMHNVSQGLVVDFYEPLGRYRQGGRIPSHLLPLVSNYRIGPKVLLDIAMLLHARAHLRKAISRVFDYADWRSQQKDAPFTIFFHGKSVHHGFYCHHPCLGPVYSIRQALESGDSGKMLEPTNLDGLDSLWWL